MVDLSILIPARNEMFLTRTVEDVLAHIYRDTEIVVVLDGARSDPPVPVHPRVHVLSLPTSIGQRAATNVAARLATGHYVMKLDAHCAVAPGFDAALIDADLEIGRPDLTQIPAQYNLHAFDWRCLACGALAYQGPSPTVCGMCKVSRIGQFDRVITWSIEGANGVPGRKVRSEAWCFDGDLHFQYCGATGPSRGKGLQEVMSSLGACFFMRRDRFFEIGGLDEAHGSWGQYGVEIACKSWLSGGLHVVNKRTWFAHLFRTQGGDFGFPYHNPEPAKHAARAYSRRLWIDGEWTPAKLPLRWLVEKFWTAVAPAGKRQRWTQEQLDVLPTHIRVQGVLDGGRPLPPQSTVALDRKVDDARERDMARVVGAPPVVAARRVDAPRTKGVVYYSDCRGDATILNACLRSVLSSTAAFSQFVAVTLAPVNAVHNIVLPLERGVLTMFRQILAGLEAIDTDDVFFCEHDVLYHPSHLDFTPPRVDVYYYNEHVYKLNAATGQAVFYYTRQTSGLCASRELLLKHYRERIARVERDGFTRRMGFEPGTHSRRERVDDVQSEPWISPFPNVDIRHAHNLTQSRWSPMQFRSPKACRGWMDVDEIPGWGKTKGRFSDWMSEQSAKVAQCPQPF